MDASCMLNDTFWAQNLTTSAPQFKGNCKTRDVEPASTRQRDSTNFSRDISKSATGLRPHEPGQLLAQSLRFVYSVFPMTRAWLARRRAAPHGRAALRAAFGGGRRFAPLSVAGGASRHLKRRESQPRNRFASFVRAYARPGCLFLFGAPMDSILELTAGWWETCEAREDKE